MALLFFHCPTLWWFVLRSRRSRSFLWAATTTTLWLFCGRNGSDCLQSVCDQQIWWPHILQGNKNAPNKKILLLSLIFSFVFLPSFFFVVCCRSLSDANSIAAAAASFDASGFVKSARGKSKSY